MRMHGDDTVYSYVFVVLMMFTEQVTKACSSICIAGSPPRLHF